MQCHWRRLDLKQKQTPEGVAFASHLRFQFKYPESVNKHRSSLLSKHGLFSGASVHSSNRTTRWRYPQLVFKRSEFSSTVFKVTNIRYFIEHVNPLAVSHTTCISKLIVRQYGTANGHNAKLLDVGVVAPSNGNATGTGHGRRGRLVRGYKPTKSKLRSKGFLGEFETNTATVIVYSSEGPITYLDIIALHRLTVDSFTVNLVITV